MRTYALILALVAACGGDDGPPLTDATSLSCPRPGDLPFHTPTHSFARPENKTLAMNDARSKDEASDTLGVPNGPIANTFIADAQAPANGDVAYQGAKARTTENGGLFFNPLAGEHVSLWTYDGAWMQLGTAVTDEDGAYTIGDTGYIADNGQPVYAMLDADGSCAEHFDYLYPRGTKVVVSDIDGTLTTDDNQLLMQISDGAYDPAVMGAGAQLTTAWAMKGYPVIYLTARPHVFRIESRAWLRDHAFADGALITSGDTGVDAAAYKTLWLNRMLQTFGWTAVAAYGNADTDITAYENAGIPKDRTFIVGPLAGSRGTQPIANMDYSAHIASFVTPQPDNH